MERLKEEIIQENLSLGEKITKLVNFLKSSEAKKISKNQLALLEIQLNSMFTYGRCLIERKELIERDTAIFPKEPNND